MGCGLMSFVSSVVTTVAFAGVVSAIEPIKRTSPPTGRASPSEFNCAVGVSYAVLSWRGATSMTIDDVERAFPQTYRGVEVGVPMAVVCEVLEAQGMQADAVKLDPKKVSRVTMPAILLVTLRKSRGGSDLGHYMLLKEVLPNGSAVLLNPNNYMRDLQLSKEQLADIWDGYAILIDSRTNWGALALTLFVVVVSSWFVLDRLFSKKVSRQPSKSPQVEAQ